MLLGWTFTRTVRGAKEGKAANADSHMYPPMTDPKKKRREIRSYPDLWREFDQHWGGSYYSIAQMQSGDVQAEAPLRRQACTHAVTVTIRDAHLGLQTMVASRIAGRSASHLVFAAPVLAIHIDRWVCSEARVTGSSKVKVEYDFETSTKLRIPADLKVHRDTPNGEVQCYKLKAAVAREDAQSALSTLFIDGEGRWIKSSQKVERSDAHGYTECRRREVLEEIGAGFQHPVEEALSSIGGGAHQSAAELLFYVLDTNESVPMSIDAESAASDMRHRCSSPLFEILRRRQIESPQLIDELVYLDRREQKELALQIAHACRKRYMLLEQRLIQRVKQLQDGPTVSFSRLTRPFILPLCPSPRPLLCLPRTCAESHPPKATLAHLPPSTEHHIPHSPWVHSICRPAGPKIGQTSLSWKSRKSMSRQQEKRRAAKH